MATYFPCRLQKTPLLSLVLQAGDQEQREARVCKHEGFQEKSPTLPAGGLGPGLPKHSLPWRQGSLTYCCQQHPAWLQCGKRLGSVGPQRYNLKCMEKGLRSWQTLWAQAQPNLAQLPNSGSPGQPLTAGGREAKHFWLSRPAKLLMKKKARAKRLSAWCT